MSTVSTVSSSPPKDLSATRDSSRYPTSTGTVSPNASRTTSEALSAQRPKYRFAARAGIVERRSDNSANPSISMAIEFSEKARRGDNARARLRFDLEGHH